MFYFQADHQSKVQRKTVEEDDEGGLLQGEGGRNERKVEISQEGTKGEFNVNQSSLEDDCDRSEVGGVGKKEADEDEKRKGSSLSILTNLYSYLYTAGNVNTNLASTDSNGYTSPPPSLYYRSSYTSNYADISSSSSSSSASSVATSGSNSPLAAAEPNGENNDPRNTQIGSPITTIFSRTTSPTRGFSARFSPLSATKGMFFAPTCFVKIGQSLQEQMNSMQTEKINTIEKEVDGYTISPNHENFNRDNSKASSPKINFFASKLVKASVDTKGIDKNVDLGKDIVKIEEQPYEKVEVDVDGFIVAKREGADNEVQSKIEEDSESPKSYMFNTFVSNVHKRKPDSSELERLYVDTSVNEMTTTNRLPLQMPSDDSVLQGFSESTIIEKEDLLVEMRQNGFDNDGCKTKNENEISVEKDFATQENSSTSLIDFLEVKDVSTIIPSTEKESSLWSTIFHASTSKDKKEQDRELIDDKNGNEMITEKVSNIRSIHTAQGDNKEAVHLSASTSNSSSSYASLLSSTSPLGMSASQRTKHKKEKEKKEFMKKFFLPFNSIRNTIFNKSSDGSIQEKDVAQYISELYLKKHKALMKFLIHQYKSCGHMKDNSLRFLSHHYEGMTIFCRKRFANMKELRKMPGLTKFHSFVTTHFGDIFYQLRKYYRQMYYSVLKHVHNTQIFHYLKHILQFSYMWNMLTNFYERLSSPLKMFFKNVKFLQTLWNFYRLTPKSYYGLIIIFVSFGLYIVDNERLNKLCPLVLPSYYCPSTEYHTIHQHFTQDNQNQISYSKYHKTGFFQQPLNFQYHKSRLSSHFAQIRNDLSSNIAEYKKNQVTRIAPHKMIKEVIKEFKKRGVRTKTDSTTQAEGRKTKDKEGKESYRRASSKPRSKVSAVLEKERKVYSSLSFLSNLTKLAAGGAISGEHKILPSISKGEINTISSRALQKGEEIADNYLSKLLEKKLSLQNKKDVEDSAQKGLSLSSFFPGSIVKDVSSVLTNSKGESEAAFPFISLSTNFVEDFQNHFYSLNSLSNDLSNAVSDLKNHDFNVDRVASDTKNHGYPYSYGNSLVQQEFDLLESCRDLFPRNNSKTWNKTPFSTSNLKLVPHDLGHLMMTLAKFVFDEKNSIYLTVGDTKIDEPSSGSKRKTRRERSHVKKKQQDEKIDDIVPTILKPLALLTVDKLANFYLRSDSTASLTDKRDENLNFRYPFSRKCKGTKIGHQFMNLSSEDVLQLCPRFSEVDTQEKSISMVDEFEQGFPLFTEISNNIAHSFSSTSFVNIDNLAEMLKAKFETLTSLFGVQEENFFDALVIVSAFLTPVVLNVVDLALCYMFVHTLRQFPSYTQYGNSWCQ